MSEALYRKYRPQTFASVVGQDHIERTIRNAIEQDKVSHAYLFCGPRGTGKTTTARLLAKALLCEHGPTPDPDGTCEECQAIAAGTHPDVYELDAASRTGVENVREEIIGRVQFAPTRGRVKVYIIDEVHMLSTAAFNALLKTLEEPPDHVVFILCTTDPQKVPETIHSRCQRFDFRRINTDSMVSRLGAVCMEEGVEFEGEALELIAHRAEGGMRNALTALEQVIAFGEGKVTLRAAEDMLGSLDAEDMAEIVEAIGVRDVAACFAWTERYIETGADLAQFARDLAEHFRNMYVLGMAGADVALDVSEAERRELVRETANYGPDRLANLLGVLGDVLAELRTSTNPRLTFEIGLTRMVRPDSDLTLASLAERVEALEAGKSAVAYGSVQAASGAFAGTVSQGAAAAPTANSAVAGGRTTAAPAGVPSAPAAPAREALQTAAPAAAEQGTPASPAPGVPAAIQSSAAPAGAVRPQAPAAASPAFSGPAAAVAPAPHAAKPAPAQAAKPACAASAPAAVLPQASSAAVGTVASGGGQRHGQTAPELASKLENPAALQRIWQAAISAARRKSPMLGTVYLNTEVTCDGAGEGICVAFPARNKFAYMTASKPDEIEIMLGLLQQAAGAPVALRLTVQEDAGSRSTMAPSASGASSAQRPTVQGGFAARPVPPAPTAVPQAGAAASTAASSTASGVVPQGASVGPAASAPAQAPRPTAPAPAVPRLRDSRAVASAPTHAVDAGPGAEAPAYSGVRPAAAAPPAASQSPAPAVRPSADDGAFAADMPRLAPKAKKPISIPGHGAVPAYVRDGIRPETPAAEADGPVASRADSAPEPTAAAAASTAPAAGRAATSNPAAAAQEGQRGSANPPAAPSQPGGSVVRPPAVPAEDYDRVPLDAYEGMAYPEEDALLPWEDAPVPEMPSSSVPASAPTFPPAASPVSGAGAVPAPSPAPAPTRTPVPMPVSVPASNPAPSAAVSPAPGQQGPEPTEAELNAFLASGFGEGVVFREVRE